MAYQNDRIKQIPAPLPVDYDRQTNFTDYQTANPGRPMQGAALDAEFNIIEQALDETQARQRLIQRDDGALQNGIVSRDSLAEEVIAGVNSPTTWTVSTVYAESDSVIVYNEPGQVDPAWYVCEVGHTAVDFSADLAAGRWRLLVDLGALLADAGQTVVVSGSGTETFTDALNGRPIVFDNEAAMIAQTALTTGLTAITLGKTTPGDGEGQTFQIVASGGDVTLDNGNEALIVSKVKSASGASQTVAGALDDRVVRVGSVEGLADLTPFDGMQASVLDAGLYKYDQSITSWVPSAYGVTDDPLQGAALVGYKGRTVSRKLSEVSTPGDTGGDDYTYLEVLRGNWTEQGGRSLIFNPDSVDFDPGWALNSVIVLGARGDTGYRVTVGPNAELAFHGGGGDTLLDHLAGVICGGAHHIMTKNSAGDGSHGVIAGGSFNENYTDYGFMGAGTQNISWSTHGCIVGGQANRVGVDGDRQVARNSFVGSGWLNTIDGQYSAIPSGRRCKALGDYTIASGEQSNARLYGVEARASGAFSTDGDNQNIRGTLRRTTTNTSAATQLLLDGSSEVLAMGNNTMWTGRILVSAVRTDVVQGAGYEITFNAYCNGAGVAAINASTVTAIYESDAAWNVDIIASSNSIQVRGIGTATATIRWAASFDISEVRDI